MAGFIKMTQEAGSSGTADIIWEDATRMMRGKLSAGRIWFGTPARLRILVCRVTLIVIENSVRLFCTGPMIVGRFNPSC